MSPNTSTGFPPFPRHPTRWRRALRSLRALLDEPEKTGNAVDVFYALDRRGFEHGFQRFAADAETRRLLDRRVPPLEALADRAMLARLPADSLGRSYLDYLDENGFDPDGLLEVEHAVCERWRTEEGMPPLDSARRWYKDRSMLCHDFDHVLTGYGTDHVGEASLLAFSWAQVGDRTNALLGFGAAIEVWHHLGSEWPAYVYRSWRRGRRARWLHLLPLEDLLPVRLETVRSLAGLEPPEQAHPGGILRHDFDDAAPLH